VFVATGTGLGNAELFARVARHLPDTAEVTTRTASWGSWLVASVAVDRGWAGSWHAHGDWLVAGWPSRDPWGHHEPLEHADVANDLHRFGPAAMQMVSGPAVAVNLADGSWASALNGSMSPGVEPDDLTAIAATVGPGLIGSLLIGVSTAKSLALAWDKPFVAVNHLEAHLYASFLEDPDLELPVVVLLVSGGHTMLILMEGHGQYRLLGQTLDDAAGEAYDKVARYLGLGYPGGPIIDKMSVDGDPEHVRFPRAMVKDGYDFSFSGLKTSVVNYVRKNPDVSDVDIAASFQEAVVDVLLTKARRAVKEYDAKGLCLAGGVAANSLLRLRAMEYAEADGVNAFIPSRSMCTDNAAMIASAGWWRYHSDGAASLDHGANSSLRFPAYV